MTNRPVQWRARLGMGQIRHTTDVRLAAVGGFQRYSLAIGAQPRYMRCSEFRDSRRACASPIPGRTAAAWSSSWHPAEARVRL